MESACGLPSPSCLVPLAGVRHVETGSRACGLLILEVFMMRVCSASLLVLFSSLAAKAEPMVTTCYAAKQPHIAAHRSLPLGTVLVITNPSNGRSAQVVIGDRGPFDRRRSLDISYDVAKLLGFEKCGVLRLDTRVEEQAAR
jgi:hypothetical protein